MSEEKTQRDELVEHLFAENSAQHQELISLRRERDRLIRRLGMKDERAVVFAEIHTMYIDAMSDSDFVTLLLTYISGED